MFALRFEAKMLCALFSYTTCMNIYLLLKIRRGGSFGALVVHSGVLLGADIFQSRKTAKTLGKNKDFCVFPGLPCL